jgi:hypothetical protein
LSWVRSCTHWLFWFLVVRMTWVSFVCWLSFCSSRKGFGLEVFSLVHLLEIVMDVGSFQCNCQTNWGI